LRGFFFQFVWFCLFGRHPEKHQQCGNESHACTDLEGGRCAKARPYVARKIADGILLFIYFLGSGPVMKK
jgi:hypothetical protein